MELLLCAAYKLWNGGSKLSAVTKLWAVQLGFWFLAGTETFIFSRMSTLIQLVPQPLLSQVKGQGWKLTTHVHVRPRVRTHGAVPRLPFLCSRCCTEWLHLFIWYLISLWCLMLQVRCNLIFHVCLTVHLLNFWWCTDHPAWRFFWSFSFHPEGYESSSFRYGMSFCFTVCNSLAYSISDD